MYWYILHQEAKCFGAKCKQAWPHYTTQRNDAVQDYQLVLKLTDTKLRTESKIVGKIKSGSKGPSGGSRRRSRGGYRVAKTDLEGRGCMASVIWSVCKNSQEKQRINRLIKVMTSAESDFNFLHSYSVGLLCINWLQAN